MVRIFFLAYFKIPLTSGILAAIVFACIGLPKHAFAQLALESRLLQREQWGEGDRPLLLKALVGMKYDSNLFRLSDDANSQSVLGSSQRDDLLYWLGVGAQYEVDYSRQKFILGAEVDEYRFQNFDNLNNLSHNIRGEWQWQVGNSWDGTVGFGHRHYLPGFSDVQQNIKDMVDQSRAYGSANYFVYSRLKLTLDLNAYDENHGAESRQSLDSKTNSAAMSINWVTPGQNTVGLQYRTSDSRYINELIVAGSPVDNNYRDNEYSLVAHWFASGASDLLIRIGHIEREFDTTPNRNFSGPTWRINYHWQPPGKVTLDLTVWQELAGFEDLTSNYAKTTGISAIPVWSITQQVALQAKAAYQLRQYLGNPGTTPVLQQREDKEQLYQIAAIWTPAKQTNVTLAVETGLRTSNEALADYDYWSVGILATRTF